MTSISRHGEHQGAWRGHGGMEDPLTNPTWPWEAWLDRGPMSLQPDTLL